MKTKKKRTKLCSILLSLVMVVGMLPTMAYAYSAGDIAGTTGSGTSESDPVLCDTFAEFKAAMESSQITYVKLSGASEVIPGQAEGVYDAAIKQTTSKILIIDGNNKFTAPLNGNNDCLIWHGGSSRLVVKGTGTLKYEHGNTGGSGAVIRQNNGSLEIQSGVTLEGSANGKCFGLALYIEGGITFIRGGTFKGYAALDCSYISAVGVNGSDASLTIDGGTFYAQHLSSLITVTDSGLNVNKGTVVLEGGTYYGIDARGANRNLSEMLGGDFIYTESDGTVFDGTSVTNTTEKLTVITKIIDPVDATITEPVAGATPDLNLVVPTGVKVSKGGARWYDMLNGTETGTEIFSTDTYIAGHTYRCQFTIEPDVGYSFKNPLSTVTLNGNSPTIKFQSTNLLVFEATFVAKGSATEYAITVTDGKATAGAGTEITKAAEGTKVTLTANKASDGKVFDKWEVVSGSITLADANSATTTFTMPAGAVSVKATYHTHSYGSEWKHDANKHWHECTCGAKSEEAAHTAGNWIVDKKATDVTEGSRHMECTVCHYVMKTEIIPAGSVSEPEIKALDSASVKLSAVSYAYTGSYRTPVVTVTDGTDKLVKDTDYEVTYSNNKYVGTAKVTIRGIGSYTGTIEKTFKINPSKVTLSKVSKVSSGKLKAAWKKHSTQTTGFQIRYSTSSTFKTYKTVTVSGKNATYKTVSKLKKGKKYYVKVRAYKTVNGTKYYGSWSARKSVRV